MDCLIDSNSNEQPPSGGCRTGQLTSQAGAIRTLGLAAPVMRRHVIAKNTQEQSLGRVASPNVDHPATTTRAEEGAITGGQCGSCSRDLVLSNERRMWTCGACGGGPFLCAFPGCGRPFGKKAGCGQHQRSAHKEWYDSQVVDAGEAARSSQRSAVWRQAEVEDICREFLRVETALASSAGAGTLGVGDGRRRRRISSGTTSGSEIATSPSWD